MECFFTGRVCDVIRSKPVPALFKPEHLLQIRDFIIMSMMKRSVFVAFVLLALVPMIHAACWFKQNKPDATHCQDDEDKTWHPVGSKWRNSQCAKCSCSVDVMGCCDGWPTRVSGGCSITYDYKTCTYELIHVDKNVPCRAVG
ncbi:beta-microseminoprotein-like isoform X1 [Tachysurus fulvidraco]|uniref:beta-microseminoprotein-like isoform X1 n=1 Tax=Tachysurus fulvidraco TaxID=1234273 RepID=UPI001FEFBFEC|nr:beta-microseminoprotein-like isoform X1 [Tachysurus fulvidraco]